MKVKEDFLVEDPPKNIRMTLSDKYITMAPCGTFVYQMADESVTESNNKAQMKEVTL